MAGQGETFKPHFVLSGRAQAEPFKRPPLRITGPKLPDQDRRSHGSVLIDQFDELRPQFAAAKQEQRDAGVGEGFGMRLTFEGFPGVELACERLAVERSGIELLNVQDDGTRMWATVFVPDGKLDVLVNKLRKYLQEGTDDKPPNAPLWNTVASLHAAVIRNLWTDAEDVFPDSDDEAIWWEVWLPAPARKSREAVVAEFRRLAEERGFQLAKGELVFPERTVLLAYGSLGQMQDSLPILNSMAALRRAKETADFFDDLTPGEQLKWGGDLLGRVNIPGQHADVPHICLLDTGVNHGHPLLQPALNANDTYTVDPAWGKNDIQGHGTNMAGLALFGNLTPVLASNNPVQVNHRLESVKLLPSNGANQGNSRHHGWLTMQAVAIPEISEPYRKRLFNMAIMSKDGRDKGQPSAWSATVDGLASGVGMDEAPPRLFVLSAGNLDRNAWGSYPHSNVTDGVHDPGQSWNALTVGAMTHLDQITEPDTAGYQPVAAQGGLSPQSTTSMIWHKDWPLKPDIVFEGGNAARDPLGNVLTTQSLQLLTTNADMANRLLDLANGTSPASALASRMAAQLMHDYPRLWPESIRGLVVHSAEWTPDMRKMFLSNAGVTKQDLINLVRCCGYGEPSLERARWSMDNSLTMVCEDSLKPFQCEGGRPPTLNEMNLHRLPWPVEALQGLRETEVEMRVTLSYFIEPNPSQRPPKSRYRYESHGLRFDVMRPLETVDQFRARINAAARADHYETLEGTDSQWCLGVNGRSRGSIHSDVWKGSASDLANRRALAIWPVAGWWKLRYGLKQYDRVARYSLIVSIRAPEVDVDLYSEVANQIKPLVPVET